MNIEMTMPTELAKSYYIGPGYYSYQQINCWPTGKIAKVYRDREEIMEIEVSYRYNGIIETNSIDAKFLNVSASTGMV